MNSLGVVGVLQLASLALIIPLALFRPTIFSPIFTWIEARLAWLSEKPGRQLWVVGLLCLGVRAALLPIFPPPPPRVADEFSLLFQAEMMLSGRFALPADPMWRHFEEMHVIAWPSYASIYFPGRSLLPALGLLLGHHWIGLWLGMAALCVAITWMLQAFARAPFALVGGLMTVLHLGIFSYWANTSWGGTLTALGATLVIGGIARLRTAPRWRDGFWAALGTALMITSRPFESMVFCLGIAVALVPWLFGKLRSMELAPVAKLSLPIGLAVVLGGASILAHSAAITGDPLKPAYQLSREQYAITPAFLTSDPLPTPRWPDARMERVYRGEADQFERRSPPIKLIKMEVRRLINLFAFYVGPALLIPFLLGLWRLLRERSWTLLATISIPAGFLLTSWDFPHYAAPLLPLTILASALGLERLRHIEWRGREAGLALSRMLPLLLLFNLIVPFTYAVTGRPKRAQNDYSHACCAVDAMTERRKVELSLERTPGQDLVFVRYQPKSFLWEHYVYNHADYARAPIIWARYRNARENQAFAARFPDRRVWIVEPHQGKEPAKLFAVR